MRKLSRTNLGDEFSEGARLLWLRVQKKELNQSRLAALLSSHVNMVHRWLYGDRRPPLEILVKIESKFDVPVAAWAKKPAKPFEPPGLTRVAAA